MIEMEKDLLNCNYLISINMLSRVVRIPVRFAYSAALKPQITNVPMVVKDSKKEIKEYKRMSQENTLRHLDSFAINFQQQVDGKKLILQSLPEIRNSFSIHDLTASLLTLGTAYGILTNFNYVLTLAFGVGAAAAAYTAGRKLTVRGQNIITSIHIDTDQRLHITHLTSEGYDTMIVNKKDFTYNLMKTGSLGSDAVWCRANNTDFWISKKNLQINNQELHHLL